MNDMLFEPFMDEEISIALFQIGPLKAPGPDALQPEGTNVTAIVLIPKKDQAGTLKDFRPISLCNVIYKIVSKCLANRLRSILHDIISPTQSAFIPGRLIFDNDVVAFECMHSIQKIQGDRHNFCA